MTDVLFIAITWLVCSLILAPIVGRAIALGNRQPAPTLELSEPRRHLRVVK